MIRISLLKLTNVMLALVAVIGIRADIGLAQEGLVKIDGSSTVYPLTEAIAEEFQNQSAGKVRITVGVSGTGGGFKKFVRGEIDISDASRPIAEAEIIEAKKNGVSFIELPVALDALTVVVNPQNTWVDHLTVEELKRMWEPGAQGRITNWNEVRAGFPDSPLKLYGAGSDSGTFDYFTEAIVGKAKSSRGDYTASEDDNVLVQGIAKDKNALGYFGFAYYAENKEKLRAVPVINPKTGKAVLPSVETGMNGTYTPLSRPLFIYVSSKALARPEVAQFAEFYMKNAGRLAIDTKYIALPGNAYEQAMDRLLSRRFGTVFGGHSEIGLSIDELFTRNLES